MQSIKMGSSRKPIVESISISATIKKPTEKKIEEPKTPAPVKRVGVLNNTTMHKTQSYLSYS